MIHMRWSRLVTVCANLALCLGLALSFTPAGLADQPPGDVEENQILLPVVFKDRIPFIESTGVLDPSFDGDGWALANFADSEEIGNAVVIQPDGKIVVAGSIGGLYTDSALARYNPDGSLDLTFSGDGLVVTDFAGSSDIWRAVALQPDGKILVAGSTYASTSDFALARYNPDGSLDTDFGNDGKIITDITGGNDYAYDVVIGPDGKIVVAGYSGTYMAYDFSLARYNADGTPDLSFDSDGKLVTDFAGGSDMGEAVLIQPADGKIVVAGSHDYYDDIYRYRDIALARYNPDGSLDTSFSSDGKVIQDLYDDFSDTAYDLLIRSDGTLVVLGYTTANYGLTKNDIFLAFFDDSGYFLFYELTDFTGSNDYGEGIAIQEDDKIVAAGYLYNGSDYDIAVVRYNAYGGLDTDFGVDGKIITDIAGDHDYAYGVVIGPGGKIVVAGTSRSTTMDYAVLQYTSDGELAPSFSADGIQLNNFGGSADLGYASALQPDGKIVVAGGDFSSITFALARFNPDGSLDTSFDLDGKVSTNFSPGVAHDVAIQADGKILVAGFTVVATADFALARYNPDGSLDTTFDSDGFVMTDFSSSEWGYALALQTDGKIVVAGQTGAWGASDFALARYNSDGSLDTSFDLDGMLVTDFAGGDDIGYAVALQADGKILVAGYTSGATTDFAVARYNPDGSLDTTFDGDGRLVTDIFGDDTANAVAVQPDGKIVVAGVAAGDFALVRYNPDGSLDTSFSADGKLVTDFAGGQDMGYAIVLQPGGKIILAGSATGATIDYAVARYNPDGSLDVSFSGDGRLMVDFAGSTDICQAVALQPDGRILLAGYAHNGIDFDFAVVRLK